MTADKEKDDLFSDSAMSFGDHLMELRTRLIRVIVALVLGFALCLFFGHDIMTFIFRPLFMAQDASGQTMGLSTLAPPEYFITYIKVCLIAGFLLASPYIFMQIWAFVAAGLYPNEKKLVNMFVPFSAGLFILGSLFFITIVAPICFKFFISFSSGFDFKPPSKDGLMYRIMGGKPEEKAQTKEPSSTIPDVFYYNDGQRIIYYRVSDENSILGRIVKPLGRAQQLKAQEKQQVHKISIDNKYSIQRYFSFVAMLLLAFGVAFQMPLVVLLLSKLGMFTIKQFTAARKYVLFGIVIFAALITPPDVISQMAMAAPMYVLYEVGIILARFYPKAEDPLD